MIPYNKSRLEVESSRKSNSNALADLLFNGPARGADPNRGCALTGGDQIVLSSVKKMGGQTRPVCAQRPPDRDLVTCQARRSDRAGACQRGWPTGPDGAFGVGTPKTLNC